MSELFDSISKSLDANAVAGIAKQLGTDSGTTQNAIGAALPLLLGGLAKNSAAPEGAAALSNALGSHSGDILGNVLGAIGGGSHQQTGLGILGHLFGGQREDMASQVGAASGLNGGQAMQLLATLAPLVMGALSQHSQQQGGGASGLGGLLQAGLGMAQQQAPAGAQGMLGSVLGGLLGGQGGAQGQSGAAGALSGLLGGLLK